MLQKGVWKLRLATQSLLSAQSQIFLPPPQQQSIGIRMKTEGVTKVLCIIMYLLLFFRALVIHPRFWQVEELTCQSSQDSSFWSLAFPPFAFGKLQNQSGQGQLDKEDKAQDGRRGGGRRWAELRTEVKPCHSSGSERRVQCSVNAGSVLSSLPHCQLCRWRAALILLIVSRLSFMGTIKHRKHTAFMCTGVCSRTRSIESSG